MAVFSLSGTLVVASLAASLIYYLIVSIISYRRLSHIPGPKANALSILPLLYTHAVGGIDVKFSEWSKQYGVLVRVAPNTLLTSDPEVWRRMSAPRSPYRRSKWFNAMRMNPGVDNVLSTRDEKRHDELRKRMAAGYSGKENVTLEKDIDDCVLDLSHLIASKYLSSGGQVKPMDLARKIQFFTSDVMSKVSVGAKFYDLRDDNDNMGYIHEVETTFPFMFCFSVIPRVVEFLTAIGIMGLMAPKASSKIGFGTVLGIAGKQVAKRFDEEGKLRDEKDMLGSFLRHGLTRDEAEGESVFQLVAGSDTSATGIRATMLNIISNPRVYTKLVAEIDSAMASGKIPTGHDAVISETRAKELPYLQACIKEGLRWYPPIVGLLAKEAPPGGDTINGYFVPEGTSIGYCARGIHQSPTLFGSDANAFRPERWILTSAGGDEPSVEKLQRMERNNDLIFGSGRHQCLGKPVAFIELNKVFVELLKRFEWTLLDPLRPWQTFCSGIHFQRNMWVMVKEREKMANGVTVGGTV